MVKGTITTGYIQAKCYTALFQQEVQLHFLNKSYLQKQMDELTG